MKDVMFTDTIIYIIITFVLLIITCYRWKQKCKVEFMDVGGWFSAFLMGILLIVKQYYGQC